MFEVGFTEMLLIAVLALVVLGPERLPRVAAQLGRWVGRARAMARQFREQLEEEASLETTRRPSASRASQTPPPDPAATASSPPEESAPEANGTPAPNSPPPEGVASTPAHPIDSNDTRHADLSEEPAVAAPVAEDPPTTHAAAGPIHERGT